MGRLGKELKAFSNLERSHEEESYGSSVRWWHPVVHITGGSARQPAAQVRGKTEAQCLRVPERGTWPKSCKSGENLDRPSACLSPLRFSDKNDLS